MSDTPVLPTPLTPLPAPLPIEQFNNDRLRESIEAALVGVDPGHGRVEFDVTNHGVGIIAVERFGEHWAAVAADRYSFDTGNEFQVAVRGSW